MRTLLCLLILVAGAFAINPSIEDPGAPENPWEPGNTEPPPNLLIDDFCGYPDNYVFQYGQARINLGNEIEANNDLIVEHIAIDDIFGNARTLFFDTQNRGTFIPALELISTEDQCLLTTSFPNGWTTEQSFIWDGRTSGTGNVQTGNLAVDLLAMGLNAFKVSFDFGNVASASLTVYTGMGSGTFDIAPSTYGVFYNYDDLIIGFDQFGLPGNAFSDVRALELFGGSVDTVDVALKGFDAINACEYPCQNGGVCDIATGECNCDPADCGKDGITVFDDHCNCACSTVGCPDLQEREVDECECLCPDIDCANDNQVQVDDRTLSPCECICIDDECANDNQIRGGLPDCDCDCITDECANDNQIRGGLPGCDCDCITDECANDNQIRGGLPGCACDCITDECANDNQIRGGFPDCDCACVTDSCPVNQKRDDFPGCSCICDPAACGTDFLQEEDCSCTCVKECADNEELNEDTCECECLPVDFDLELFWGKIFWDEFTGAPDVNDLEEFSGFSPVDFEVRDFAASPVDPETTPNGNQGAICHHVSEPEHQKVRYAFRFPSEYDPLEMRSGQLRLTHRVEQLPADWSIRLKHNPSQQKVWKDIANVVNSPEHFEWVDETWVMDPFDLIGNEANPAELGVVTLQYKYLGCEGENCFTPRLCIDYLRVRIENALFCGEEEEPRR